MIVSSRNIYEKRWRGIWFVWLIVKASEEFEKRRSSRRTLWNRWLYDDTVSDSLEE